MNQAIETIKTVLGDLPPEWIWLAMEGISGRMRHVRRTFNSIGQPRDRKPELGLFARRPRGSLAARPAGEYDPVPGFRPWQTRLPMAKGKKKLEVVHLVCEETGDMNYTLRRKTGGEKLKVKKYSPRLRKHTLHNEKRK